MTAERDVPLRALTTMRVGGPARRLVTATSADEVVDAVRTADDAGEPLLLLSGGSNLVVSDAGFDGTVVRMAHRGVTVESEDACQGVYVRVAAGEDWDGLVERAVASGWAGIEALSGIPGLVGATPVQNVGAYGQDVSQTVARVRTWDRVEGRVRTFTGGECGFSYRHSRFKGERIERAGSSEGRYVVLEVDLHLRRADLSEPVRYAALAQGLGVELGTRVPLADARAAVLEQRSARGMVLDAADPDTYSCGSFFTNPVLPAGAFEGLRARVLERLGDGVSIPSWAETDGRVKVSAAWLIERAGCGKGYGMPGPASLSSKHTLAVTNRGSARAQDVIGLARRVRDEVRDAFGITLVNEPVLVGLEL